MWRPARSARPRPKTSRRFSGCTRCAGALSPPWPMRLSTGGGTTPVLPLFAFGVVSAALGAVVRGVEVSVLVLAGAVTGVVTLVVVVLGALSGASLAFVTVVVAR